MDITLHLPLVTSICAKVRHKYPAMPWEDLIQSGCIGLCKAYNTYDASKAKFSTFAYTKIMFSIIDSYRMQTRYSVKNKRSNLIKTIRVNNISVSYDLDTSLDIKIALSTLSKRERYIVCSKTNKTPVKAIAKELKISTARVNKIYVEAIIKLRKLL